LLCNTRKFYQPPAHCNSSAIWLRLFPPLTITIIYSRLESTAAILLSSGLLNIFSYVIYFKIKQHRENTRFLNIRSHFIRNLHVDSRNIERAYTTNGKQSKELLSLKTFKTANIYELGSRFQSYITKTHTNKFIKLFPTLSMLLILSSS